MDVFKTYKCHKVVEAAKITDVKSADGDGRTLFFTADDGTVLSSVVDSAFVAKHSPQAGGYIVKYADGYESYSPAEAFENGYDLVESTPGMADPNAPAGEATAAEQNIVDGVLGTSAPAAAPAPAAEAPAAEVAAAPAEETKTIVADANADVTGGQLAAGAGEQAPAPAPVAEVKAEETPAA